MELLNILHFLTFLALAIVASPAELDIYWKTKLPNTPIPKAVTDLLLNGNEGVDGGGRVGVAQLSLKPDKNHTVPIRYAIYASEDEVKANPYTTYFFLEKDLYGGTSMNLLFAKSANTAAFLPRQVAESIPFSTKYVPEILNKFAVKPGSVEAEIMKKKIAECEEPGIKGEEIYCATSLESMIDFATSNLGKNVRAFSTEAQTDGKIRKYGIVGIQKLNNNDQNIVASHKQNYVYAVFYCHTTQSTDAYMVSLKGTDGANAKVVAVCHKDTSEWNPNFFGFQVLRVKPGTPICHFLPEEHVIWAAK